jgi:hypothetical protein
VGAFIGAKGRMADWARAAGEGMTRGQNRGHGCLAVTSKARRGASSARDRKMLPAWRFPEGESGIIWASGGSSGCWRVHMAGRAQLSRGAPAS